MVRLNVAGTPIPSNKEQATIQTVKWAGVVRRGAAAVSAVWPTTTSKARFSLAVRLVERPLRWSQTPVVRATAQVMSASNAIWMATAVRLIPRMRTPRSGNPNWMKVTLYR